MAEDSVASVRAALDRDLSETRGAPGPVTLQRVAFTVAAVVAAAVTYTHLARTAEEKETEEDPFFQPFAR